MKTKQTSMVLMSAVLFGSILPAAPLTVLAQSETSSSVEVSTFEEFQQALTDHKTSIVMTKDIVCTNNLMVTGYAEAELTINGNGYTLSGPSVTSTSILRIQENRDFTVTINNLKADTANLQRCISLYNNQGITLNLSSCQLTSNMYTLNIAGMNSADDNIVTINAENCTLSGWSAVNIWSKTKASFTNCVLTGTNPYDPGSNNYGVIVVSPNDGPASNAEGTTLIFDGCTINAIETNLSKEYFLCLRSKSDVQFKNTTFSYQRTIDGTLTAQTLSSPLENIQIHQNNTSADSTILLDNTQIYPISNDASTIIVPNGTTTLSDQFLDQYPNAQTVILPESLIYILNGAFVRHDKEGTPIESKLTLILPDSTINPEWDSCWNDYANCENETPYTQLSIYCPSEDPYIHIQDCMGAPYITSTNSPTATSTSPQAVVMYKQVTTAEDQPRPKSAEMEAEGTVIDELPLQNGTYTLDQTTPSVPAAIQTSGTWTLQPVYTPGTYPLTVYNAAGIPSAPVSMTLTQGYFTVTFDLNNGKDPILVDVKAGSTAAAIANPEKTGYTFAGWTLNGKPYDFKTPITSDLKLTAQWTANSTTPVSKVTLTIQYVDTNGTTIQNAAVARVEQYTTAQIYAPDIEGYTIQGDSHLSIYMNTNKTVTFTYVKNNPDTPVDTSTGWIQNSDGSWSYKQDGQFLKNTWLEEEGNWYHFDSHGFMQTGFHDLEWNHKTDTYFFDNAGHMKTGWLKVTKNGSDLWYYFNKSGQMQRSTWVEDAGNAYWMQANGVMLTGWLQQNSHWYFMDHSGARASGWKYIQWNGVRSWYYFYSDGVMASNTMIGIYKIDASGVCTNPDA